ncbi:hypothetical protein FRC03_012236 [Tulasnella sp. 419]|nr:hypothetical protein FRC03_012236 [Tulasnella sp. 419]
MQSLMECHTHHLDTLHTMHFSTSVFVSLLYCMAILIRHSTARPMMEMEPDHPDCPQGLVLRIGREIGEKIETEWSDKLRARAIWPKDNIPSEDIVYLPDTGGFACQYALIFEGQTTVAIAELFIYEHNRGKYDFEYATTEYDERKEELRQGNALFGTLRKGGVAGPDSTTLIRQKQVLWIIRRPDVNVDHISGSNASEGTEEMEIDNGIAEVLSNMEKYHHIFPKTHVSA